ncbi:hypothetical protein HKBW3S44_00285, partial [Candidatus Hakubella thermalkaliphila]
HGFPIPLSGQKIDS